MLCSLFKTYIIKSELKLKLQLKWGEKKSVQQGVVEIYRSSEKGY